MGIFTWFIMVLSIVHGTTDASVDEEAQVNWTNSTSPSAGQDRHPSLPDNVVLTLTIGNETFELNLNKKQDDDFEEIPVIVGNNKNVKPWHHSRDEEFSVYSDESKDASFSVVVKTENGTIVTEYYGSFVQKGIKYNLMPENNQDKTNKLINITHKFSLNGTRYVVYGDTEAEGTEQDIPVNDVLEETNLDEENTTYGKIEDSPKSADILFKDETSNFNLPRSSRKKREVSMDLLVDLMIVIDNSLYRRWLTLNSYDKDQTIERMRYYLAYIINGVNNVYMTMVSHRLSVSVVGIFIAETPEQSEYFENPSVKVYVDERAARLEEALNGFSKWVKKHKLQNGELVTDEKFLPDHDVAAVFTDYREGSIEGLAPLGSICGKQPQTVVHATGQYDTISRTAHEIGHILGSDHDGDGNDCNPADHYLMSPILTHRKIENRNNFSNCSIAQIVNKVINLERQGKNCLDSSKKQRKKIGLDKLLDTHPGFKFGPDEQCQMKFGNGYKFCSRGIDTHLTMCNRMSCLKIGDKHCYIEHPLALDGTTCGKGKWCISGKCVFGAPVKPGEKETCYFGDKSDIFMLGKETKRCNDFLDEPKLCYKFDRWCCETCAKIKEQKNIPLENCAYGDKGIDFIVDGNIYGCELVLQRPYLCTDPENADYCCESCNIVKNSHLTEATGEVLEKPAEECEDQENYKQQCKSSLIFPRKCYKLQSYCCQTCATIRREKVAKLGPNCPYGDQDVRLKIKNRRYSCSVVLWNPEICTNSQVAHLCCESCFYVKENNY